MYKIKFKKLNENALTPIKAHDTDACFDMVATSIESTYDYIEYGTGISLEIPVGWVGMIFPRSSVTKYDLMLKNSVGIIDPDYRGEIKFRFNLNTNLGNSKIYSVGDRIGQIMFLKLPDVELVEADELNDTIRGANGYGSTGQ